MGHECCLIKCWGHSPPPPSPCPMLVSTPLFSVDGFLSTVKATEVQKSVRAAWRGRRNEGNFLKLFFHVQVWPFWVPFCGFSPQCSVLLTNPFCLGTVSRSLPSFPHLHRDKNTIYTRQIAFTITYIKEGSVFWKTAYLLPVPSANRVPVGVDFLDRGFDPRHPRRHHAGSGSPWHPDLFSSSTN